MKKFIIFLFILIILSFFCYNIIIFYSINFIKVDIQRLPESIIIKDVNWLEIWEIIKDKKYRHRYLSINDYPSFLKEALILLEDRRFYDNNWVDYISLLRATKNNVIAFDLVEWASTISSQLVRNNQWLNKKRTYSRKVDEFLKAISLNYHYKKDQILELYMNNINFWYMNYWFQSASKFYFWKDVSNLTRAELIALLTIPKNPNKYNPLSNYDNFKYRYNLLIEYLYKNNLFDNYEYDLIKSELLTFRDYEKLELPYIKDFYQNIHKYSFLFDNNSDYSWWTLNSTIDYFKSVDIKQISDSIIDSLSWKNVSDYWVIVIDRKDNSLKVMIWWRDYNWESWNVNSTLSLRQVWSTLKPFTYLKWLEKFNLEIDDNILDLPILLKTNRWYSYEPKNYDLKYQWSVSIAEALSQSLNIPAVIMAQNVWIDELFSFYKKLWFNSLDEAYDYYGAAVTLWVWEITLFELVRAYSIFANEWNLCNVKMFWSEKLNCQPVSDKDSIDKIVEILSNRYFKIKWFPLFWNLDFADRFVFVKSWTSRNFSDNLAVWFTENYVIWVWVWNKDWERMKWVSWVTWAWKIFREIVYYLEHNFYQPKEILLDWEDINFVKVTSPINMSIYNIDNSIPSNKQEIKLEFESNIEYDSLSRDLNWKKINLDTIDLNSWDNLLTITLYKNGKVVWKNRSYFIVMNEWEMLF